MNAALRALARQIGAEAAPDGQPTSLRSTRLGQLFTANWKVELLLSGHLYHMTVGTITGGGDIAPVTGGGAGTTIDEDQPEWQIGVPTGYFLIPVRAEVACQVDLDADLETGTVTHWLDLASMGDRPIAASSTIETPSNLLGGGPAVPFGHYASAITTDITDPTVSEILGTKMVQSSLDGVAANLSIIWLNYIYDPSVPFLAKGPAAWYGGWGGTAAVPGIASLTFGIVPIDYFQ